MDITRGSTANLRKNKPPTQAGGNWTILALQLASLQCTLWLAATCQYKYTLNLEYTWIRCWNPQTLPPLPPPQANLYPHTTQAIKQSTQQHVGPQRATSAARAGSLPP